MAAGSTAVGGVSGAIFQGPCILIERVAVSVTFLLIVFKEDTDNIFVAADSATPIRTTTNSNNKNCTCLFG